MSTQTMIECPKCSHAFELNASLTQKIEQEIRTKYDRQLADSRQELSEMQAKLDAARDAAKQEYESKLAAEKLKIKEDARKQADEEAALKLRERDEEIGRLAKRAKEAEDRVAEARKKELDLLDMESRLKQEKADLELNVRKQAAELAQAEVDKVKGALEDETQRKLSEKDKELERLRKNIDELRSGVGLVPQELQGEAFEVLVQRDLESCFPNDLFAGVAKGVNGADLQQTVQQFGGKTCGSILYEMKNAKNWNKEWIARLKANQRTANVDIAVIVSTVLPAGVNGFGLVEGVWVTGRATLFPLIVALREQLVRVADTRLAGEGQQTKAQMMYDYLTGNQFRARVEAIVEAFEQMRNDLESERRAIQRLWSKREREINKVLEATAGMYGEMQGIAGQSMRELESMQLLIAEGGEATNEESEA